MRFFSWFSSVKFRVFAVAALILCAAASSFAQEPSLQARVSGLLDRWTSVHWGQDNLAWVVHYPDDLVDPWVRLEAQRRSFGPEETASYKKSFREELNFDNTRAFLLTVHAFGMPIKLGPVSKSIYLVDGSGNKQAPVRYEKRLDQPMTGLVQGFLFFKKPVKPPFKVVVSGLIPGESTVFGFKAFESDAIPAPAEPPVRDEKITPIPTPKPTAKPTPTPRPKPTPIEIILPPKAPLQPQPPVAPVSPPKPSPTQIPTPAPTPPVAPVITPPIATPTAPPPQQPSRPPQEQKQPEQKEPETGESKEQALSAFLEAWKRGENGTQYEMLSKQSKNLMSRDEFTKRAKASPFQWALAEGYKVDWQGDRAVVSVTPKMLIIRTLYKEAFTITKEDERYHVTW